jgi:hypothetical protein
MARGLPRYIATVETSKHRFFTFLDQSILPDNKLIAIAADDAFVLGILSSCVHGKWSLASGSWLGVGNDSVYVKSRCFEPFPFPLLEESALKQRIRDLGERLDAHRKRQQEQHPDLTLTGIYNVLQKIRSGEALNAKDKTIHDQGIVSVLKQIHDDLDAAVLEAYGWQQFSSGKFQVSSIGNPPPSSLETENLKLETTVPLADLLARGGPDAEALEQAILTRLVALNHERAAEEKRGLIRWLRPDYQASGAVTAPAAEQSEITLADGNSFTETPTHRSTETPPPWPETMAEQVVAVRKLIPSIGQDPESLAACFGRKSAKRTAQITAILDTLKALGHIP